MADERGAMGGIMMMLCLAPAIAAVTAPTGVIGLMIVPPPGKTTANTTRPLLIVGGDDHRHRGLFSSTDDGAPVVGPDYMMYNSLGSGVRHLGANTFAATGQSSVSFLLSLQPSS